MAQSCRPKVCRVCSKEFQPNSRSQWRCTPCKDANGRPEAAPLCGCGCGKPVNWSKPAKGWSKYLWGHHINVNNPSHTRDWAAKPNPHKGEITVYEHKCAGCAATFIDRNRASLYCSNACYAQARRGSASPLYVDGRALKDPTKSAREARRYVSYTAKNGVTLHRAIMRDAVGRDLLPGEVVHHIDRNPRNNVLSNLYLFHCDSCHKHHHATNNPMQYRYDAVHEKSAS